MSIRTPISGNRNCTARIDSAKPDAVLRHASRKLCHGRCIDSLPPLVDVLHDDQRLRLLPAPDRGARHGLFLGPDRDFLAIADAMHAGQPHEDAVGEGRVNHQSIMPIDCMYRSSISCSSCRLTRSWPRKEITLRMILTSKPFPLASPKT